MKPVDFPESNIVIAENQDEYVSIPAHVYHSVYGETTFCWSLSWRERIKLLFTGRLWHRVLTFNEKLQPQLLGVDYPFAPSKRREEG